MKITADYAFSSHKRISLCPLGRTNFGSIFYNSYLLKR